MQVFYGTIPLILVITGVWFREQLLLKDILRRLGFVETELRAFKDEVRKDLHLIRERLITLETRAGIVFH